MFWISAAIYKVIELCKKILDVVRLNHRLLVEQAAAIVVLEDDHDTIIQALAEQGKLLEQVLAFVTPPEAVSVAFYAEIDGEPQEIETMVIQPQQTFPLAVVFKDKHGNTAPVDGVPAWVNDNESVLADGMSAVITSINGPGSGQISVSADADLGEGVRTITGVLQVEVLPDEATVVELNPGPVTDVPTP